MNQPNRKEYKQKQNKESSTQNKAKTEPQNRKDEPQARCPQPHTSGARFAAGSLACRKVISTS